MDERTNERTNGGWTHTGFDGSTGGWKTSVGRSVGRSVGWGDGTSDEYARFERLEERGQLETTAHRIKFMCLGERRCSHPRNENFGGGRGGTRKSFFGAAAAPRPEQD